MSSIYSTFAQIQESSPLTRYGMGNVNEPTLAQNKAFGNSGVGLRDNNHINFMNPASYSSIDSLTFLFETGVSSNFSFFSEGDLSSSRSTSNIEYLSMSFPVTRWWSTAVGILPYSKVGYNIIENDDYVDYNYQGDGGLNQLIFGNSFKPVEYVSLGVNASYIFGETYYSSETEVTDEYFIPDTGYTSNIAYELIKEKTYRAKGLNLDIGMQIHYDFDALSTLTIGVVYGLGTNLSYNETITKSLIISSSTSTDSISSVDGKTTIPSKFGVGFSFQKKHKFLVTADYSMQNWSNAKIYGEEVTYLQKASKLSGGFKYIPNAYSAKGYLKRVSYKAGAYYRNTGLLLTDSNTGTEEAVTDIGMSFGIEFPFRKTKNTFCFSSQFGQKGTSSKDLIKERYLLLNLNITLHESWFYKTRID